MSQNQLFNGSSGGHRDYGATSSSTGNMIGSSGGGGSSSIPDVNFSGFSPTEFMSLSKDISDNIHAINSYSKQLDKIHQILGITSDQQETRDRLSSIYEKANERIETTTKDLIRLTAIIRRGDKQQKLQLEKLTNDFSAIVERYTSVQTSIAALMRQHFLRMEIQQVHLQEDGLTSNEADRETLMQTQAELEQQRQFEHDMLVERERQILMVEAKVLDSNAIMQQLSKLVHAQHEQVDRIESYVENAATEIEMGREQLSTAAGRRQSYRRKILILLVIAVIIGLIITGIIVSKLGA